MGLLTRAGDLIYTIRFLKLLTTSFEKTKAFELGLIDKKGKRLKKAEKPEEKNVYTAFHRLVYNIKRLIPGGKLGSFATALFMLRENFGVKPERVLEEAGIDPLDLLAESSQWFLLEDKRLSPGVYKMRNDGVLPETYESVIKKFDRIRINEDAYPIGEVLGLDIYEGQHLGTGRQIYFTVSEITR